jgi:eukaryotic-like serine/threonine-protein kinase
VSVPTSGADAVSGNVGTTHLGRYELVCEIAKAQIGALWAGAADGEAIFVRRVALGTPLPAALHERLSDAARWAASARLPGFAPVLDVVATGDEIGVVSEYRDGECLRALLRQASFKRTPLPLGVSLRIAIDVIDALEATEGLDRITPASLWPDSVLVGSDGVTSLLDLGVASVVAGDPAWSAHPELASYSAPEKLEDAASASTRSDVFVVGILLWEMVANQRLFTGLSAPAARQKVLTAPLSRLDASKIGTPANATLADIVERALNRKPDVRFFDVTELRAALQAEFSDTIASPEEVGTALSQISGSLMSIRRRAIDKALGSGAKHTAAALPAETVEKLRGVPANATLLGVAPLAVGSAPSPNAPATKPVRSGTLLGFPTPDLGKSEESTFPKRPPAPPPPRPLRPTGVQREDSVDDLLAPLEGLEPERDELESLDEVLDEVRPLPKPAPPPPPFASQRPMSTTAPLGTMSDSVAPDSVDALIASSKGSAQPAPFGSSTAPMMAHTAPLGTDVMAQFGSAGGPPLPPPPLPPPRVPSSFPAPSNFPAPSSFPPAANPVAQAPSEPPAGAARPLSLALKRNRKIVIGVVAAMALLLTVAIVVGAVRSRSAAKDEAAAEAKRAAKAKAAKSESDEKPTAKAGAPPAKQAKSVPATPKKAAAAPKAETAETEKEEAKTKTGASSALVAAQTKARAAAQVPKGGLKKPAAKPKPAPKKPVAKAAKKPAAKPAKAKPKPKPAKAAKAPPKKKPTAKPGKKVAAAKKPH